MFFKYPIAATTDNWISSTLLDAVRSALEALQQDEEPPEFLASVPEDYRAEFSRGEKFPELYNAFVAKCRPLTPAERSLIINSMIEQNNFPAIFAENVPCSSVQDALPELHEAAKNLFRYAFGRLSASKTPGSVQTIRHSYHQHVHPYLGNGCCPFCGLEIIDAPDSDLADPDWDHYLAVSKYPFAGVNLRNLTVMGTTCNRTYKGARDILCNESNQRVDCIDPYGDEHVTISLEGTALLSSEGQGPAWVFTFTPQNKTQNWRRVFNLDTRLKANVLDMQYKEWLERLIKHAKKRNGNVKTLAGALEAVRAYRDECEDETLAAVTILKKKFLDLIEVNLSDPEWGARTLNFISAVSDVYPPPKVLEVGQ